MEAASESGVSESREVRLNEPPNQETVKNLEPIVEESLGVQTVFGVAESHQTDSEARLDTNNQETDKSVTSQKSGSISANFSASVQPGLGTLQGTSCVESNVLNQTPETNDVSVKNETESHTCVTTEDDWQANEPSTNGEAVPGLLGSRLTDAQSSDANFMCAANTDGANSMSVSEPMNFQTDSSPSLLPDTSMKSLRKSPTTIGFNDGFQKLIGGKGVDNFSEEKEVVNEPAPFGEFSAVVCSPKPLKSSSLTEAVDLDEPAAKKPRTSDSLVSRRVSNEPGSISTVPSSANSSTFSKTTDPSENRKLPKESLYFDGMQLFGSKRESKVTISPVRNKDFGISGPSSTGSLGSSSSTASGSVTITKLSTGSTLNVESKDLKTILGNSGPGKCSKVDQGGNRVPNSGNGFRLAAKLDLVTADAKQHNTNTKPMRIRSSSGSDGSIRCTKCWEIYSSKDGNSMHICTSSQDQNLIVDGVESLKNSPSSSKDSSDHSRSSSRAESPASSSSPSLNSLSPIINSLPGMTSSSTSNLGVKKLKISAQISDAGPTNSVKCKFIKDSKDELHIEGRPKLSIVKVPRLECGSSAVSPSVSTKPAQPILPSSQTQVVPKLKLSALPPELKRDKWLGNVSVPKDSVGSGDSSTRIKPIKLPSEASKKLNFEEMQCEVESNERVNRKVEVVAGAAKIRIKYSGAPSESFETVKPDVTERQLPEDSFPFAFSGRPTYSPSRVEPNVPTKESPRDASSKDSPASQADSGVFSIASSSSPSKADGGTNADGTSPESPNRDRMSGFNDQAVNSREWKPMEPSLKHVAQPSASPFSGASSNQSSNSNLNNSRPGSYDQSFRTGGQIGSVPSSGNQNNSHVMFNQQQQQRQQQHNHMNFMNRLPSESDFGVYSGFGINKLSSGSSVPGQNQVQAMSLQQQQQQRQQFAYSQRMFGFGTPEPEPKKKRGRPRKNETKEPGTKRAYKRRPKNVETTPLSTVSDVNNSVQQPLGTMNQPLSRASIPGMAGNRPHQQMGSVYNFEDEEANEDLGSILPRRLTGSTQSTKQKYSFGSSSDEEIPRPPQGAVHQQNLLPGSRPTQGNGPFQNYHFPHTGMGGMHTNQMMPGMHQKNPMGIGTIGGMGGIRGAGNIQQNMPNRPIVNQHQQLIAQQQPKPSENLQMSEEDCRYSSEILEKDKGIGIKIKIKKAGDSNNSSALSSSHSNHQQELQQHHNQHQSQNCIQDQQKQQNDLKESSMSLGERLHGSERISASSHSITSPSQSSISTLSHVQQLSPSVASGHPFMGKNVNPHIQSQQSQHMQQSHQHHNSTSSPSTLTNQNNSGYSSPHNSSNFSHTNTHMQNQPPFANHGVMHTNGLQQPLHQHPQQQLHHQQSQPQHSSMQQPNSLVGMGQRPGMTNGHPNATPPLRSPFNSTPSPSHQPHFGQQIHQPNALSHSYRFIGQNQVNSQAMAGPQSQMLGHQQNQSVLNQKAMMQQQGQVMNNFYYNQGMNNSFNMQSQQNQYQQGNFPVGGMSMSGPTFGGSNPYRYANPHNGSGYNGYTNQYGGMMNVSGQNANAQFQDQQFNNQFNCHQQFGNNMMFGSNNGMTSGGPGFGNRMTSNNEMMSQPVPPNFRHQQQMMQPQPVMNQLNHGNMMGNVMNSMPLMSGNIGQPRISPSSMHKPMPGVGLVSPSVPNRQQQTPLVSPQSLHSMSEHSPASSMHNQPLTPGNNFGGPTTPQSVNPMTPMGMGMTSPMTPAGQNHIHPNVNQSSIGFQQNMMSPLSADDLSALRSPSASASNLRKVRRPSKAYKDGGPVTPKPEYDEENLNADRLGDFGDLVKDVGEDSGFASHRTNQDTSENKQSGKKSPGLITLPRAPSPPPKHSFKLEKVEDEPPAYMRKDDPLPQEENVKIYEARWEELDEKLWKKVFQFCVVNDGSVPFLVRASRVCSKWHKVSQDASLWTHLDLSQGRLKEKYRNDKKLEWFLRKYPSAIEVKIGGWKNTATTTTLKLVSQLCPNLVSFGLSGCSKLTNEDMKVIADSFPKLERIDLSGVSPSSCSSRSAVSSTCLSDFIATVGSRLTHFSIANNKMSGLPFVFKALSTHSSSLEVFDISNITTTSRDTILINIEKFQKGCQKLRVLNANHTMLSLSDTPIKEQVQSPGFPNLRELHVAVDSRGYFDGMEDQHIERILKKSASLRLLDIRGCQNVTESCLIRLPTWDLERLAVAGCSAAANSYDGLELVVKKWANKLIDIDISLTTGRAVNNAIDAFAESDGVVLRKLNLYGSSVNVKSLTRLLKNCPTLECVNLSACKGLPRGMKRMYGTSETVYQLLQDINDGKFSTDGDDSDD